MHRAKYQAYLVSTLRAVALAFLAGGAMAQTVTNTRYPISEADIVKELNAVGVNVSASNVHLPMQMSAVTASPQLEILASHPIARGQVQLELRCHSASVCLPFIATVDVNDSRLTSAEIRTKYCLAIEAGQQTTLQDGLQINRLRGTTAVFASQPQLRAGSRVVLLIRDGHLDIHLQVLAIDSGTIGQQVRVSTLDHKKIFHATVIGEGTVAGGME